ncbi:Cof-type HAD-IIB family hydrolase [Bacillus weihaiensis]|uniref:Cof-type HAD-IIB family hydrolase n=1 Tax=Bacillus weihaiensis TaxID=1547283 RepID=UPI002354DE72|nr:Cof-type HAD-IIB family hydrolase [Bacillus weihaiensis]
MNYKIVFFDIDGTLTSEKDGSISSSTKNSIKALLNCGMKVVAATGRPYSMCNELMELGIETFITANGAYVKHKQSVIYKNPLNSEILRKVVLFAQEEKYGLSFYTEDLYVNDVTDKKMVSALEETLSIKNVPTRIKQLLYDEVYLVCLFADEPTVRKFNQKFPHLSCKRWHPYIVNVLDKDVAKSIAVSKVLEHFSISPSEAVAFGDGENDLDMLEIVGLGIAMGNSCEKLKEVANYVTRKSSEAGIEYALKKFGLIKEKHSNSTTI